MSLLSKDIYETLWESYSKYPCRQISTTINISLRVTPLQSSLRAGDLYSNPHAGSRHHHKYKSTRHSAAEAAPVPLTGIRNPSLRLYLLIPVVPSDARISAHASMAAILSPVGDLYTKNKKLFKLKSFCHDQSGNRTRVCAVRGRRLSRLTNWPQSRRQDSNLRPQRPERCALPNWATPRWLLA